MFKLIIVACLGLATVGGSTVEISEKWISKQEKKVLRFLNTLKEKCEDEGCYKKPADEKCPPECQDGALAERELLKLVQNMLKEVSVDQQLLVNAYITLWNSMERVLAEMSSSDVIKFKPWLFSPDVAQYLRIERYVTGILEERSNTDFQRGVVQVFIELEAGMERFDQHTSVGYRTLYDSNEPDAIDVYHTLCSIHSPLFSLFMSRKMDDVRPDAVLPKLNGKSEEIPRIGQVTLVGKPIAQKSKVVVYKLRVTKRTAEVPGKARIKSANVRKAHADASDPWVIKYQANRIDSGELFSDIMRDAWFLGIANKARVAPKFIYLSPPAYPDLESAKKIGFDVSDPELTSFTDEVRFMVMERIDYTVENILYSDEGIPNNLADISDSARVKMALNMAIGVVDKLRTLHTLEQPVVHGDIHIGNIAVKLREENRNTIPEPDDFVLIDFGKAFFEAERPLGDDQDSWPAHCFLSHFNLRGERFGFRDDVYKTLLAAAFLMVGGTLIDECLTLASEGKNKELIAFHQQSDLFGKLSILEPSIGSMSLETPLIQVDRIKAHLAEALKYARGVKNVRDRPNYEEIINHLKDARKLIA